ncbi:hypothetical protein F5Y08DRAFT_44853 [Xylaria arbuscula]|nr:hypothetical protein F5Y08DRAFT_44853 [Xylaria arbuscula]
MLTSHVTVAFIELNLLDPKSSLSIHLQSWEKSPNAQLETGTIFLQRNHVTAIGDGCNITEIRISWNVRLPDRESEVEDGLTDLTSQHNLLDHRPDPSEPTHRFTVYYQLVVEIYTSHDNGVPPTVHHRPTWDEIYGDVYQKGREAQTKWFMCSSRSPPFEHRPTYESIRCIDISASYSYGHPIRETIYDVLIRINMRTKASVQLILQHLSYELLKDEVNVNTQTSIIPQKLILTVNCRRVDKIGDNTSIHDDNTPKQQKRRTRKRKTAATNEHGALAARNPVTPQSRSNTKSRKRRRDSEEMESEHTGGQSDSNGTLTKRSCTSDNPDNLACPFYKMYPWKFDRCLTYKMSKMSYVKQHVFRYHDEPDCVTTEQKQEIQRTTERKITSESKWYQIWSILFPGAEKPDSPFVKAQYFAEVLSSIQAFYHKAGPPHILEETLRQVVRDGHTYQEAFDSLLQRIERQVLGGTVGEGLPFSFDKDVERAVSRKNPSTDSREMPPFSSIAAHHNLSPLTLAYNKEDVLALECPSELQLYCSPQPQEAPFVDEIEGTGQQFESLGDSQPHYLEWPIIFSDNSSLAFQNQDTADYADDVHQMGAIIDFNGCFSSSPTTTCDSDSSTDAYRFLGGDIKSERQVQAGSEAD